MQGARASLDDLAVRWETPKGREVKNAVVADLKNNLGRGLKRILHGFIYTDEVHNRSDLRCITLEGLDLNESSLENVDMSWSSFKNSSLGRISFTTCSLKRATFEGCQLNLSRFKKCDLSRVDFSNCNLEHANFQDSKLTGSRFIGADLARASLEGANLSKCNFLGARLEQANLANADCTNSNFSDGALSEVAAKPSKIDNVRFEQELTDFESEVGLKALTFRSTRTFKGLDALLKMNEMLAAAKAAANPTPAGAPAQVSERPTGAPPPADLPDADQSDPMLFGAPLRTTKLDRSKIAPPEGANLQTQNGPEAAAEAGPSADYYGSTTAPPGADAYAVTENPNHVAPADYAAPTPPPAAAYADPRPRQPGPTDSARITRKFYDGGSASPIPGGPKVTRNFQKTPPPPTGAAGPRPTRKQSPVSTGRFRRAPQPNRRPPSGVNNPPAPPNQPPGPGPGPGPGPRSSGVIRNRNTQRMQPQQRRPHESGVIRRGPPMGPGQTGRMPMNTRRMPRKPQSGVIRPTAPFNLAPPAPDAPDPTSDWATAMGQLLSMRNQITKIVIETGGQTRQVYKKDGTN